MSTHSIKVADEGTAKSVRARDECKGLIRSLNQVIGCYRNFALNLGGSSDSTDLRGELRRTREKAQELAVATRIKLTEALRDKELGKEERSEMERLWVLFSSNLEGFHMDMCKVLDLGQTFSLSDAGKPLIQTGMMSEGTSEVAARALSVQNLVHSTSSPNWENVQLRELEEQIGEVDRMVENMEMKVNVLRWTVEAKGGEEMHSVVSNDFSSMALLSLEGEEVRRRSCCDREKWFVVMALCTVALVAVVLSVCVVNFA